MKEIVLEVLQELTDSKKTVNKSPSFVLDMELHQAITERVKQALRELYKTKHVQVGRTINNNYMELINGDTPRHRNQLHEIKY